MNSEESNCVERHCSIAAYGFWSNAFHWELLHPITLHLPPNSFLQFLFRDGSVW